MLLPKELIKRYIKFIIAHFALNCNSAFRSDLYFLKGFGDRRCSLHLVPINSTEEKEVNL